MSQRNGWLLTAAGGAMMIGWILTFGRGTALAADEPAAPASRVDAAEELPRSWMMKTLGGGQYWGDVQFYHTWRIQQNVISGHFRLLDGNDYRHASGTLEECRAKLDECCKTMELPAMQGKAVIVVHGIIRSSKSFNRMKHRLQQEGYLVLGFDYPSTQMEIAQSAEYLHHCIESLEGIEEINFVVHSMGGLLVRSYLKEHRDERIHRMVMLGVPNRGAHLANKLKGNWLFRSIFGPAGQQLVRDPEGFIAALPIPDFEFGIIAGSSGREGGYNLLIPGDDDGTVSVDSARLEGATDFLAVRGMHSFLMSQDDVIEATVRYVKDGRFREDGERYPILPTHAAGSGEKSIGNQVEQPGVSQLLD